MEILIKALQFILALSLLVFVHELGHYLSARMFGIRVEKFYIFMDAWGVSLFKFKWGETTFGIGWLPFGGYCKISGMVDESMDTEQMKQPPQPWEFRSKPAWQRLVVMVGGVVMNVIAAWAIYTGISWHWGESYIDNADVRWGYSFGELGREIGFRDGDRVVGFDGVPYEGSYAGVFSQMVIGQARDVTVVRDGATATVTIPGDMTARLLDDAEFMTAAPRFPFVVNGVAAGGGAAEAGMMPGDSLVALGGVPMTFNDEFTRALGGAAGTMTDITVVRDSVGVPVRRTMGVRVSDDGMIGIELKGDFFPVRTRDFTFAEAVPAGMRMAGAQISSYWQQLKLVAKPKTEAYRKIGSFITIGSIFPGTWDWMRFWFVTAFISIALAVMNILPIPALDGGHSLFLAWEIVTRRRPSDKFLERAQMVGMILLLVLLALTFWNDIYRFVISRFL